MMVANDEVKNYEAVKWLAFLLRTWEFSGSKFGPETGYPDRDFVCFLSPSGEIKENRLKLGHDRFLPHPFQFVVHPIIRRYT
jgi:hypothetical protein